MCFKDLRINYFLRLKRKEIWTKVLSLEKVKTTIGIYVKEHLKIILLSIWFIQLGYS